MSYEELTAAAAAVRERTGRESHRVAVVLGSGLGDYAAALPGAVAVPYSDLPGFPVPRVEGHGGTLVSAAPEGLPVLVLSGRVQLWWRGQSIILTEVVNHPRKRVLVPLLAAGNQEDLKVMAAGVEMWAVAQGCSEVWLTGRKGWLRSFLKDDGWEQDDKITLHRALGRAR